MLQSELDRLNNGVPLICKIHNSNFRILIKVYKLIIIYEVVAILAIKSFLNILEDDCFLTSLGILFQILTQSAVKDLLKLFKVLEELK